MRKLPFIAREYRYTGRDERKQQKVHDKNRIVYAIVKHANRLVANNPSNTQLLIFGMIAHELNCDVSIVRHTLSDGGYNGITLWITDEDRQALALYKTPDE